MEQKKPAFDVSKVENMLENITCFEDLTGPDGVLQEMLKNTFERLLKAEQELHLGYSPYDKSGKNSGNSRNGYTSKKVKSAVGDFDVKVPRDRNGEFEPVVLKKNQAFDPVLEKQIVGMYTRGMSVRDIQSQLQEIYGTEISPTYVSKVTDKMLDGIVEWQQRPLETTYAVVFLDAIHFKIRHEGKVQSRASYTCMGIDLEGNVDVLGMWIAEKEGAHFWQTVLVDLKERGVEDILIACVDGLKGFSEAITANFPHTQVQLCIVHQIRTSLRYTASKYHKALIKDMKELYKASTLENAEFKLLEFEEKWKEKSAAAVDSWKRNWAELSTFFDYPQEIRTMIYTTNYVEALHRQFRKVTKSKGSFPSDEALKKMLYLATQGLKVRKKRNWAQILGQLKNTFPERVY